jgi:hypothetical protein
VSTESGSESGAESQRRASGAECNTSYIYYIYRIYIYIYILYCYVLDMQFVLINLCHMYVVASIVTESDYFNL